MNLFLGVIFLLLAVLLAEESLAPVLFDCEFDLLFGLAAEVPATAAVPLIAVWIVTFPRPNDGFVV